METLTGHEVVRAAAATVRAAKPAADASGLGSLEVRFSVFNTWYRIASFWEGEFLERVAPGTFTKTIKEQGDRVRVMFDHGFDPQIGEKILGTVADLREDRDAAVGVVDLFDTSYNRDLLPGLEAGVYGSSMRFVVTREEWVDAPEPSDYNPKGLPERTIKEAKLIEFGPVPVGANPDSTAEMMPRSATDEFYERLRSRDPERVDLVNRARPQTSPHRDDAAQQGTSRADGAEETDPTAPAESHPEGTPQAQRRRRIHILTKESAA